MHVAAGTTRTVILIGRLAFKLPGYWKLSPPFGIKWRWRSFLHGLLNNMDEVMWFDWEPARRYLAPVLFSLPLGFLVVMRRADPMPPERWSMFEYGAFTNRPQFVLPVEEKRDSFGIINKRVVAVDYGG